MGNYQRDRSGTSVVTSCTICGRRHLAISTGELRTWEASHELTCHPASNTARNSLAKYRGRQ